MIEQVQKKLQKITGGEVQHDIVASLFFNELEWAFALDINDQDVDEVSKFPGIDFRENYVRLKVGQEVYDEVLQSIETDILSAAILEAGEI